MKPVVTCKRKFVVSSPVGLHLRSAALLAETASRFNCDITVHRMEKEANAKSLMSIIMLEAPSGAELIVTAEGPDAQEAMTAIHELLTAEFREQE